MSEHETELRGAGERLKVTTDVQDVPARLPGNIAPLWSVAEVATFLGKSPRWVWRALTITPDDAGSVPHVRIGASPRFVPDHIRRWILDGCPPAATFRAWQDADEKRQRRAG
ncbi:MAG TPA: helix-turn-helix domain-containing protein [Planctomycetota bacterium]|jgi:hypothetical protein